jgi:hypothetical protein
MRLKFDFVETNVYRMDIELPESVLLSYCEAHGVSMNNVKDDPESYAYDISQYIATHFENLGDGMEFREGEGNIYNAELKV